MAALASLKRSSPLRLSKFGFRRLDLRPFSNVAGGSSSSFLGESNCADKSRGSTFGIFPSLVSGVVAGSSLGFWIWSSSSPEPSICYADSATSTVTKDDQQQPQTSVFDLANQERRPKYLFGDAYRRKVFFNYEKRLRLQSPPEKVFEYFASLRSPEGEIFMTPADLMRAIVPVFPPYESNIIREGHLRGERNPGKLHCADSALFKLFDTNNDGLISFSEYIFFVTLLSIPETSFSVAFKMFDLNGNGEIEREEFKKVMALMRTYNRQGACHKDGRRTGFRIGSSVENGGLVEYFFGKDGNGHLQHGKFVDFLKDLHNEVASLLVIEQDSTTLLNYLSTVAEMNCMPSDYLVCSETASEESCPLFFTL